MERTSNMPLWVFLGLMNVETRKGALILVGLMIGFALASVPLSWYLEDWSWAAMMLPMGLWYWLCLRWADRNAVWQITSKS